MLEYRTPETFSSSLGRGHGRPDRLFEHIRKSFLCERGALEVVARADLFPELLGLVWRDDIVLVRPRVTRVHLGAHEDDGRVLAVVADLGQPLDTGRVNNTEIDLTLYIKLYNVNSTSNIKL